MASTASPSLVVFAWGNESRGDDGAGPGLAARLRTLRREGLVVIEDMQLKIEHVADIEAGVSVLFVDASVAIARGFALQPLDPADDPTVTTHALSPAALLRLYETTSRLAAPDAWQLHVAGRQFGLGETMSRTCSEATEDAWHLLRSLLAAPAGRWRTLLAAASRTHTVEAVRETTAAG